MKRLHRYCRVVLALGLGLCFWLGPQVSVSKAQEKEFLKFIPPDAVAASVYFPSTSLKSKSAELFPSEVIIAATKESLGINPEHIATGIVVVNSIALGEEPEIMLVLELTQPYELGSLLPQMQESLAKENIGTLAALIAKQPKDASIALASPTTVLMSEAGVLRRIAGQDLADGPLRKLIATHPLDQSVHLFVSLEQLRPIIEQAFALAPPLPGPFAGIKNLATGLSSAVLDVKSEDFDVQFELTVDCGKEETAQQLETVLRMALALGRNAAIAEARKTIQSQEEGAVKDAMNQYVLRMADKISQSLTPAREGDHVVVKAHLDGKIATIGVLSGLLIPAVQAAREAARNTQESNQLKQIGLGLHLYHEQYRQFPAKANLSPAGRDLLSWRVHILPFLGDEEKALYGQFHLDEPWDSPHNSKLVAQMPDVYKCVDVGETGKTAFLGVSGRGTLFSGVKGHTLREVIDGTSRTIMVVRSASDQAVEWTKPEDWKLQQRNPLDGLKVSKGQVTVLMVDGGVRRLPAGQPRQFYDACLISNLQ